MRRALLRPMLLVAGPLLSACAGLFPTPPAPEPLDGFSLARFDRVDDRLYRGAQPSEEQLKLLATQYHIRTVVKLDPTTQGRDLPPPGVALVYEPIGAVAEPSQETVKRILDEIEAAPKPVFVHCRNGEDRTGLIVALYRIRHGVTVDAAYTDMVRHGFHPYSGVWSAWLKAVGWDHPSSVTRR